MTESESVTGIVSVIAWIYVMLVSWNLRERHLKLWWQWNFRVTSRWKMEDATLFQINDKISKHIDAFSVAANRVSLLYAVWYSVVHPLLYNLCQGHILNLSLNVSDDNKTEESIACYFWTYVIYCLGRICLDYSNLYPFLLVCH